MYVFFLFKKIFLEFIERTVLFMQAVLIFIAWGGGNDETWKSKWKMFSFHIFLSHNIELIIDKRSKIKKSYNRKVIQRLIINIFIILLKILLK